MGDLLRKQLVSSARLVVVKVGTNVLTDNDGQLDHQQVQALVDQLERLHQDGRRVVLVSSGAIGAGMKQLGLSQRPSELPQLQACAAVGQSRLMQTYQQCFAPYKRPVAQILLTAGDFEHRVRYLNVRNTIHALFEYGAMPIINENDTVSVAEIRFGDNDHLAALVTNLLQAPLLILLTSVDGLYSEDPRVSPSARLLTTVERIDGTITSMAAATRSSLGTGGMKSKLRAARQVTAAGEAVVIANGRQERILDRLFAAEPVGTLFLPHGEDLPAWKRWLGFSVRPKGTLHIDAGAERALIDQRKSLLPVGVVRVEGNFSKGDLVAICGPGGREIARGLCNYSAIEAQRLCGLSSTQIRERFGLLPYAELVHRDNLVIIC
ncbi:MAG: glutamate 5-kinase [Gemmataceae bacterium]|nr:glutamate 5-kinase [Gemmataceae bacterium]MDW8243394.1 glutamate 5-kinase [Thermogemmata sp.]